MKHMTLLLLCCLATCPVFAQSVTPDLQSSEKWQLVRRKAEPVSDKNYNGIRLSEEDNDGLMILKDFEFSEGVIDFDVKGKNSIGHSFVGIAFHLQNDSTYDAVYFRPFNFLNPDTIRRWRAVQYISSPNYGWPILREQFPGKYENKVNPVPDPDGWFHVRVEIEGNNVKVFVNNSSKASLEVEKISNFKTGGFALMVGNTSGGSFANLVIKPKTGTKKINYGNNPEAGRYINVGDAKLYYEVYGTGEPLVLLHGGVYGYIDEFGELIKVLSEKYQLICVATRGHGKSEAGRAPFTWQQRADDAYKVIRAVTKDSTVVLGFSDGGYSAYKLAATHPDAVKKLIVIGAGDRPKNSREKSAYSANSLLSEAKEFFEGRLALMPEPKRWDETLTKLNTLYNEDAISKETFQKIQCPTLILAGDRDAYQQVETLTTAYRSIAGSSLAIVAGCHHVVFFCNLEAVWSNVLPFLERKK